MSLSILLALLFVGSAAADGAVIATPTEESQAAGAAEEPQPAASTPEAAPTAQPEEAVAATPPPEQAVAATPPPVEAVAATPPPVEAVAATPPPVEAVAATPPPVEAVAAPLPAEEAAAMIPAREETSASGTKEEAPATAGATEPQKATSPGPFTSQPPAEALPQTPAASLGPLVTPALAEPPPLELLSSAGAAGARQAAAQRAHESACELSLGPATGGCTVGWLSAQNLLSASPAIYPSAVAPWVTGEAGGPATGGRGGGRGDGGVAVGSRPVSPSPAPPPSGASGGAPAGSSGSAPSIFLTLAGLLLLAAPRAMRRMRLLCRPWLTAFFVLIPERPG